MTTRPELDRLRALIRIPTVSRLEPDTIDHTAFDRFREQLAVLYPLVHERIEHELIGDGSLLYRWPGRGIGAPTVIMAHFDVVPADELGWTHPPFAAELVDLPDGDQAIWGRGTLDDKGIVGAVLEAVEARLADGRVPDADVYLSFGHDEELAGSGASAIVDALRERGIRPGLVIDEGGIIMERLIAGLDAATAMIGVCEKGFATVELSVDRPGGHSAFPMPDPASGRIARAIYRIGRHRSPTVVPEPTLTMFEVLGRQVSGTRGYLMRHARTFRRLLGRLASRFSVQTDAMVRTTRAVTQLQGSAGANIIPDRVTATVNMRIVTGSSVAEAVEGLRKVIDDPEVQLRVFQEGEPSPVSPNSGPAWDAVSGAIRDVFPDVLIAPYVMLQVSDSRHFTRISENVYRFLPYFITNEELASIHAVDERIRVSTYLNAIRYFDALLARV